MTNQSDLQQSIRDITGTSLDYNGDWSALFDLDGIPAGDWNGRLLAWINLQLGTSYTNLTEAQNAYAVENGAMNWSALNTGGQWWRADKHVLDGVAPLAVLSPASGRSMLNGRAVNDNALISRQGGIKYVIGPDGSLQTVPANTLAYDWSSGVRELLFEGQTVSGIRNATGAGGYAPNNIPTYWGRFDNAGLSQTYAYGSTNGVPWVEVRTFGTAGATLDYLFFEATTGPGAAAVQGDIVTCSVYAKLVAGTLPSNISLEISERNASGAGVGFAESAPLVLGSELTRVKLTATMRAATCAFAHFRVKLTMLVGAAVDFTIRYMLPQQEKGAVATSPIPSNGAVTTRLADVAPLWASAGSATAWAWRGNVPVASAFQSLLDGVNGPYINSGGADPSIVRLAGADTTSSGFPGVIPGVLAFCGGWGASGRTSSNAGSGPTQDAIVPDYLRTSMGVGHTAGLATGQVLRLRELVAWQLPDRPSSAGCQAQARLWSA